MTTQFDPVLVEVMKNELTSVGEEMGITMKRTARSLAAKEGSDFSTALVDPEGRVIAQGLTIGIHLGYIKGVMPWVNRKFAGRLKPGDIIVSNDPYGGVSHLPDIVLVAPIFWHDVIAGFAAIVAHHTDIGGRYPGGMGIDCADMYQEGLRLPSLKLYNESKPSRDLFELIEGNVRAPEDVIGDLEAQAAACRRGVRGVQELLDKYGLEKFVECNRQLREYSERVIRSAIAEVPDGDYAYEDLFEDDGLGGPGVQLKLTVKIRGDSLVADFTGSAPQVPSAINVPFTLARASVYVALRSILSADAPANEGLFAPIEVIAPEGCVVNPRFPAAVGARGMMMWRIIDVVFGALARAIPGKVYAAGEGGINMMIYRPAPRDGITPPMLLDMYGGGWGGRPNRDGIEGVLPMAAGGASRAVPAEMIERECPVIIEGTGFVTDTGGAGTWRGSLAVFRRFRFLEDGVAMVRTCRVRSVPYGLAGGHDGTPSKVILLRDDTERELARQMTFDQAVEAGDTILHIQPGAGGYGDPFGRDPALVLEDVLDDKISPAYAEREYGVALNLEAGKVDTTGTARLRERHEANRAK
jgi:N-methylhydantoinase B